MGSGCTGCWASAALALSRTPAAINRVLRIAGGMGQFIEQAAHQCPAATQSQLLAQAIQPHQGGLAQPTAAPASEGEWLGFDLLWRCTRTGARFVPSGRASIQCHRPILPKTADFFSSLIMQTIAMKMLLLGSYPSIGGGLRELANEIKGMLALGGVTSAGSTP